MTHPHPGVREALLMGRDAAEEALNEQITRYTRPDGVVMDHRGRIESARAVVAKIEAALAAPLEPQAEAPDDPMDWPLPCDVTVGGGTHCKGTKLRSLVGRMQMLHREAFGDPPSPEEAARNLAALQACAQATPLSVEPVAWTRADTLRAFKGSRFNTAMMFPAPDGILDAVPLYASPPPVAESADAVDARRYRWLRDHSEPAICAFYLSVGKAFDGVKFARETVDEAIDAQIAAAPAGGEPTTPKPNL